MRAASAAERALDPAISQSGNSSSLRSPPHPPLRGTFSREREKGLGGRRMQLAALAPSSGGSRHLLPWTGEGIGCFAARAARSARPPHPALRATFSRGREKGLGASPREQLAPLAPSSGASRHLLPWTGEGIGCFAACWG